MSPAINQDEINSILWKACDTFRGTVDPAEYKNYILVMLFVKYISDVWYDRRDEFRRRYGGDEERVQRRLKREPFVIPDDSDFDSLYAQRNEDNLGEIINIALDAIEDANKGKLDGVFRNIDFNSEAALGRTKQRNERLKDLLGDFHNPKLNMRPSRINGLDVIGNAYEYLIGKFAAGAGKKAGEFYTPPEVSTLLARLVAPQPGDRISDSACGSGSLLIRCAEQIPDGNYSLWGQESNGSTWALAKMNMFLHKISSATIEWGDTLRNPLLLEDDQLMRFDVVVANPPFSLDKWGQTSVKDDRFNRFHRGLPPKSKGDYAFISHMIETTDRQTGRMGVIVPHGVLFRGGAEGKIRKQLIAENLLDAVVGLPANLFYGTGIPAAILVFRRSKKDRKVMFVDAGREFEAGSNQNVLRPQDADKIVATVAARKSVDKYAYLADLDEIAENDYNLNIPRYVDTFEEEELVDLTAVQAEISNIERQLTHVEQKMGMYLKELEL
ncbi:MAG: type I restriction-modification system subunit M [Anaerolineales bacterium]|nr:type I restriction-modification system subunit M [Anaerolineales bacterium]